MDTKSFAIEINEKYKRAVDVKMQGSLIEIQALGYKETAPFYFSNDSEQILQKQAQVINELVTSLHIHKKTVHVVIPDAYTFSQIVEMPQLKEKELLAAIRYQADEFIPMPIDETNIDIQILKENEKTKKLLLFIVACPKKVIEQVNKTVEMARLSPDTLENETSAAIHIMSEVIGKNRSQLPPYGTASLIINFGYSQTSLYLVDESTSTIVLARTFKLGIDLFLKEMKVNLNWEEPKIVETLRSLSLTQQVPSIENIIAPGIKEIIHEIEKFMMLARDRYNLTLNSMYLYNFDSSFAILAPTLQHLLSKTVAQLPIQKCLVHNQISASFAQQMPSFISVLGGSLE